MSEKSTARGKPAPQQGQNVDRDTLPDQEFLRDQMEALLASPAVTQTRRAVRDSEPRNENDPAELDTVGVKCDAVPNADAELLGDALRAAGKSA